MKKASFLILLLFIVLFVLVPFSYKIEIKNYGKDKKQLITYKDDKEENMDDNRNGLISPDGRITSLLKKSEKFLVPNIVHFVWFSFDERLKFHQMISIRSAYLFIKPDMIILHCDNEPTGYWWKYVKNLIKTLIIRKITPPKIVLGKRLVKVEHQSDIARIQILQQYGGIYLDFDVIVLKSFDDLRYYNYTMGLEYFGNPGKCFLIYTHVNA